MKSFFFLKINYITPLSILIIILFFSKAHLHAAAIPSVKQFKQIGQKMGANPGGVFLKDSAAYYFKFPAQNKFSKLSPEESIKQGEAVARNEVLIAKLYRLADIKVPDLFLIHDYNNNLGTGSLMEPTFKSLKDCLNNANVNIEDLINLPGMQEGLVMDAWLANWDAIGSSFNNIGIYTNSSNIQEAYRVDVGGAGLFSGTGVSKGNIFGETVSEWELLRGASGNIDHPMSGHERSNILSAQIIYGMLTKDQVQKAIETLNKVDDEKLLNLINLHASGSALDKQNLYNKLLKRKQDLLATLNRELIHFSKPDLDNINRILYNTRLNQMLKYIDNNKTHHSTKESYINVINSWLENFKKANNYHNLPPILQPDPTIKNIMTMIAATSSVNNINNIINDRMTNNFSRLSSNEQMLGIASGDKPILHGVWVKGITSSATQKSYFLTNGYNMQQKGGTIGYDIKDDYTLGIAFSYINSNIRTTDKLPNKSNISNYIGSFYALNNFENNIFISVQGQFGIIKMSQMRNMEDINNNIAKSSTKGNIFGFNFTAGYNYIPSYNINFHFIPSIGLSYNNVNLKSYNEKNTKDNSPIRAIGKMYGEQFGALIGLKGNYTLHFENYTITPGLHFNIFQNLDVKNSLTKVKLAQGINEFTAPSPTIHKTFYNLGSIINITSKKNYEFSVGYDLGRAKKFHSHTFNASAKIYF